MTGEAEPVLFLEGEAERGVVVQLAVDRGVDIVVPCMQGLGSSRRQVVDGQTAMR